MAYFENQDGTLSPINETIGKNGKVHYSTKEENNTESLDSFLAKKYARERGLIATPRKKR